MTTLLMVFGFAVIAILLMSFNSRLNSIEEFIDRGGARKEGRQNTGPALPPEQETFFQKPSPTTPTGPNPLDDLIDWFRTDWILKLGVILLLIGFGWFITYAFLHNWIGPVGRIAIGIVGGAIFLAFGALRMKKYVKQGSIFLVFGSTVILMTFFAARTFYDFFTPTSALIFTFLSIAFVGLMSVLFRVRSLAFVSLFLAYIAPLLTHWNDLDSVETFLYLLVVMVGTIWIVAITSWHELPALALIGISLYSLPRLMSIDHRIDLLFLIYLFSALLFISNLFGFIKSDENKTGINIFTGLGTGILLLSWILRDAPETWQSLILLSWSIVFAIGAFSALNMGNKKVGFATHGTVAAALLAAATAVELDGATLTIALTIEATILTLGIFAFLKDMEFAKKASFFFVLPIALSLKSINASVWRAGYGASVFNKEFFALFILSTCLLFLGVFFLKKKDEGKGISLSALFLVLGSVYAYILLWLSLHLAIRSQDTASMVALTIYTIISLIAYFYGKSHAMQSISRYGSILLGAVILRLLFVEVWNMAISGRIITFFVIGALLMGTAFIGRKKQ